MLIITISINQHHDIRRKDEQNFVTSDFCKTIEQTDRRTIDRRIINTTSIETKEIKIKWIPRKQMTHENTYRDDKNSEWKIGGSRDITLFVIVWTLV
jgi:hypothetical protein